MAATLEELKANIDAAVVPGFRARLLARGQARAMIWRDGSLPEDAPNFGADLSDDLLSYGYSLLQHGLRYVDLDGDAETSRKAFEVAAEALEAVVARGAASADRDFHRLAAAAAYHLGRFSARAYSLLYKGLAEANLSAMEKGLAKLMLRDLDGLAGDVGAWFASGQGSEGAVVVALNRLDTLGDGDDTDGAESPDERMGAVLVALEDNFMAALAVAMLALERGDEALLPLARERLQRGLEVASELEHVPAWWCHRLAIHLLGGLWETCFHKVLPLSGPPGTEVGDWTRLRKLFIASLYRRSKSEVELWPSQLQAAQRVLDAGTNLVLSLPTSAGKTRIAELCILACLAKGKRIVFVTPLRALSAQTEVGLRRTFTPLGKSVSSLYGSIGASGTDVDALRSTDIVVATPEKLDFALRSDPTLLDDVGLVVLDEGHMIGLGEREVRYEAQIQRLLRRSDADGRRIVCLSAILPEGHQLEDFAAWLTRDQPDGLIKDDWRPTRLRFGEIDWKGQHAQLNVSVGDEKPFIPKFVVAKKPTLGRARKLFPADQGELCIATAWRLVEEGQTVLVFCPMRRSVLPLAASIIEMHRRGHIESVLAQPVSALATALAVGTEWFGPDHDILACLKLGVAVHHGALPTPYRKEVERLLREGVLRITVSSPTLAQGLNLAATSLVFRGVRRGRDLLDASEFRNVVGRAGRAYVDVEGLVLYPMFDNHRQRRNDWQELVSNQAGREMESGLLRLVAALLRRMIKKLGSSDASQLIEYVAGQAAWEFPALASESTEEAGDARQKWEQHLASLDTAIFSLLGDAFVLDAEIEAKLDEILVDSLFQRRLARHKEDVQRLLPAGLHARAKYIWRNSTPTQRRGYFLAGVGLAAGKALDERAPELERLLLAANVNIGVGDQEDAVAAITAFAEIAFDISPFRPEKLIDGWKPLLRRWLLGESVSEASSGNNDASVQFIEQAFVYNLPWAMEAVRVRAEAHEDLFSDEAKLSDYPRAHAVAALETGTLVVAAAVLIQAGFGSRLAAIQAVTSTGANFDSLRGLVAWLASEEVQALSTSPNWPTPESHALWLDFHGPSSAQAVLAWAATEYTSPIAWQGAPMPPGTPLRLGGGPGKERSVFTADFREVGTLSWTPSSKGLIVATSTNELGKFGLEYLGPGSVDRE
ncbi:MAG: DEAD/DEAH box helicase [Burkholderiaceae bacterium]|nr:DEAD/DEAH box helicase [Burkholderiaceae bacterium]